MTRSRDRWYLVALVLVVVAVVAFSIASRPAPSIPGSAATTGSSIATTEPTSINESSSPTTSVDGSNPEPAPDGVVGAESAGDPYYPNSGNGGYDAQSYQVDLDFDPDSGALSAVASIDATVTAEGRLGRFSFDLQPSMVVSAVSVDGAPAHYRRHDAKLVVTPTTGAVAGSTVRTVVTYAGTPGVIAGGTGGMADGGWYRTKAGGAVAIGEPFSASAWYPVNEHPSDRATFAVTALVPTGWKVIANGLPVTAGLAGPPAGKAVFGWQAEKPMASYLTTVYIDPFTQTERVSPSGIPVINAYAPGAEQAAAVGDKTATYLDFLASKFGPYPFASAGGIYLADDYGFALETQTRPVYSAGSSSESIVIHESAHQWFGDLVTIGRWSDICLNECFASYAEWLWAEQTGDDIDALYRATILFYQGQPSRWTTPLVDMGAGKEFGVVYTRGPLAMHALRAEMGDEKFSELLLSWIEDHAGKTASWTDFEELVSRIAGKDESGFLQAWFHSTVVPPTQYLWPGPLHP